MSKTSVILFLILLCLLGYAIMYVVPNGHTVEIVKRDQNISRLPFRKGERFTYEVRYKGLKLGRSTLTFHGEKDLGDKKVYHITFFTKIPSLKDTEELYANKETFLPLEVHRTLKKRLGFSDRIKEIYDQENFRVEVRQKSKLRSKNFSIQKDAPLHNAILLTYYYRRREDFNEDERLKINLPTFDSEIIFNGIETINTPLGEYQAYAFISDPPKFKFWLSTDEKRIPLKIRNPGMLGYSLIIRSID